VNALAITSELTPNYIIGGAFTEILGATRNGIAIVDRQSGTLLEWNTGWGVNGTVETIKVQPDGKIFIGGSFLSVDGTVRNNVARLLPP
jgi:Domain of unknown function (DUF5122) beta-propeller